MTDGHIFGTCDERFRKVETVFIKNFEDKWEREGAEIAIYYKGQLVVDLQGGYKDAMANIKWDDQTRTVAVAALCIWTLIDKGRLQYTQRVIEFWPAFGKHGKEEITVEDVLTHRAGLPTFDTKITLEMAKDPETIAKIIEEQTPLWTPSKNRILKNVIVSGSKRSAYHAVTYGWLLDQIVRRVDEKRRSLSEFAREELFIPHGKSVRLISTRNCLGIDFHIGLPFSEQSTISRLSVPSNFEKLREIKNDPRILIVLSLLKLPGSLNLLNQVKSTTDFIQVDKKRITLNNPEIHALEQPAALGITKAREIARLFALHLDGKLVSKDLVETFQHPQFKAIDIAMRVPIAKGYGFMYEQHPFKKGRYLYGHPGYGGSTVMMDGEDKVVIAYVTNGLKISGGELTGTYRRLRNAALACAHKCSE